MLLPIIFYIDGATTGQFANSPVTAVKFSLGIFTRKACKKEFCWRTLGCVPAVSKHIKVLEQAGLIMRGRRAQFRPCTIDAAPLAEVASPSSCRWIGSNLG